MTTFKTPKQVAAIFGCTQEQAAAQMQRNAKDLRAMAVKAAAKGKHNGYTQAQLVAGAMGYEKAAK
jgi:hypothetical protein